MSSSPPAVSSVTAGFPVTDNATFSLWRQAEDMQRFAA